MAIQRSLNNKILVELGTELKLNVHIAPIDGITINDYDYQTTVYCNPRKSIVIPKEETINVDEENYIIRVDTTSLGAGDLYCKVTAYIPDEDFNDGLRTEVVVIDTMIDIVKSM